MRLIFKDPIESHHRVPTPWVELNILSFKNIIPLREDKFCILPPVANYPETGCELPFFKTTLSSIYKIVFKIGSTQRQIPRIWAYSIMYFIPVTFDVPNVCLCLLVYIIVMMI